ncbi:MAG: protein kinase domain-containing protein, partial [bacterium]
HTPFNLESIKKIHELSKIKDFPVYLTKILDYGFDEELKSYYVVEEYCAYGDLLKFIKEQNIEEQHLRTFIYQMNEALNYLHSNEIVHCDIKPSNILIKSLNPLIFSITDYNIASYKPKEVDIKLTSFKLTPAYASPERFTNIITPSSDYWALGITLIEMITKRNPFENIEPNLIAYKILTQGIEIPATIKEPYKTLIKNLVIPNPNKRWTYKQLRDFLEGKQIEEISLEAQQDQFKITYKNKEYKSLEELLLNFLRNEEEFKDGAKFLKSNQLINILPLKDKQKLEEIFKTAKNDELALNFFISYKFTYLPPYLYSQKFNLDTIINTLRKLKNKNILSYEDKKILELIKNYLENKSPSLEDVYNYYKEKHFDMEMEAFLINLKKFIVPPNLDEKSFRNFAFTLLAFVDKNYILPPSFENFKINKDLLNVFIPLVDDLLTIEEFNSLKMNLNESHPNYKKFLALLNTSNVEHFLYLSQYFKKNISQILSHPKKNLEKYISILRVIQRYFSKYGIINTQVEFFLRNPDKLNEQNFRKIYQDSLDLLVQRINSSSGGFPIGIGIGIGLSLFAIILMIFSFLACCSLPYPYQYILGDFLAVCFVGGLILLFLAPLVGGILTVFQKFVSINSSKKITAEELRTIIEREAGINNI